MADGMVDPKTIILQPVSTKADGVVFLDIWMGEPWRSPWAGYRRTYNQCLQALELDKAPEPEPRFNFRCIDCLERRWCDFYDPPHKVPSDRKSGVLWIDIVGEAA